MTFDEIITESEKDLRMNPDLSQEMRDAPLKEHKYIKEYHYKQAKLKVLNTQKVKLEKKLFLYYSGAADEELYKQKGTIEFRILKQDIQKFIDSDDEMIELKEKIDYIQSCVDLLNDIVFSVKQLQWKAKTAIEYTQFTNGS
jgi:hypothetical protein